MNYSTPSLTEVIKLLEEIKDNPKLWKAGGAGGQDEYAGLPPFIRNIDHIISLIKAIENTKESNRAK